MTEAETPQDGWPAQPALTPQEMFLEILREDVTSLMEVAATLKAGRCLRRKSVRGELSRRLAGVIAHCETLRLAIR